MATRLISIKIFLLSLVIGKINLELKFKKRLTALFANSENISNKNYAVRQSDRLLERVQRYFRYVLKNFQPYIGDIKLTQSGFLKSDFKRGFIKSSGEQYLSVQKPQFIRKDKTSIFLQV